MRLVVMSNCTYLAIPPAPNVLLDAQHYKRVGLLYLGPDGNYRWNRNKPLKRWMRAGRIAIPFNAILKAHEAHKLPHELPQTWHDRLDS